MFKVTIPVLLAKKISILMACEAVPKIYERRVICFVGYLVMEIGTIAPSGISCFLNEAPAVTNRTRSLHSVDNNVKEPYAY